MTTQEVQLKANEKVKAITTLCEQLQVEVSAEQMITKNGFIKQIVYYTDTEKYDVDAEVPVDGTTSETPVVGGDGVPKEEKVTPPVPAPEVPAEEATPEAPKPYVEP